MWVKICGTTSLDDALLAAESGADAVGFVFAPGKRTVTAEKVATITPHLPSDLETIGVFTTTDAAEIVRTIERAGLSGIQLHGPLDFGLLTQLRTHFAQVLSRCTLIQVLPWWTDVAAVDQQAALAVEAESVNLDGNADALLIDSRTREATGGTGQTLDWAAARDALTGATCKVILAGGLRPENVREAIHAFQPWGVDVASGVEVRPGQKDVAAVTAFVQNAKSAERTLAK